MSCSDQIIPLAPETTASWNGSHDQEDDMPNEIVSLSLPEVLMTLDGGGVVEDVQERIRQASAATRETGKKSTLADQAYVRSRVQDQ